MSLAVLILGTVLYLTREKWQHVYKALPGKLSAAKAYDGLINGLINGSRKLTNVYMSGSLRHYMIYIFVFFIA
ncbi:hypothetical protein R0J91_16755, partial [Micrococcus sp. SIMBA_131]